VKERLLQLHKGVDRDISVSDDWSWSDTKTVSLGGEMCCLVPFLLNPWVFLLITWSGLGFFYEWWFRYMTAEVEVRFIRRVKGVKPKRIDYQLGKGKAPKGLDTYLYRSLTEI
jgi:hypothetical protein